MHKTSPHRFEFGRTALLRAALAVVVLALPLSAEAGSAAIATAHVNAEIVARAERAAPGERVDIAIRQSVADGWHTYWRNPGDSGAPTEIGWTLPAGVAAGPLRWPTPERLPYPPLVNYGYSGTETLLTSLTVPPDWPAGEPINAEITIDWLVCSDICIPESGTARLSIPTGVEGSPDSAVAFAFLTAERELPKPVDWAPRYETAADGFSLVVTPSGIDLDGLKDAYFFPADYGVIDHSAAQAFKVNGDRLALSLAPDGTRSEDGAPFGVLALTDASGKRTGYLVGGPGADASAPLAVTSAALPAADGPPGGSAVGSLKPAVATDIAAPAAPGLLRAIVFALVGGLILNLMPCVFPVLALKAIAFVGHGHEAPARRIAQGLTYTAGIIVSFLVLAGALLAVKAGGAAIGWGFQLQQPLVVAVLAYVLFLVGLNLSGVYEIGVGLTRAGQVVHGRSGLAGSFLTGVLAAVVATPCTAPFMAVAVGYALTAGTIATVAVFVALGIGLALPFLVISMVPAIGRALPKPGAWMLRLRQVLAFPVFATAAWLAWVLAQQAGVDALFAALLGAVVLAFAAWLYGLTQTGLKRGRWLATGAAIVSVAAAVALLAPTFAQGPTGTTLQRAAAGGEAAEPFVPARLASLRADGKPVFVNVTAAWCITCKVNERVALGEGFREALKRNDVAYLNADWTSRDPEITALLEDYGRAGVPLYLVYPSGGGTPKVLPQLLTEGIVVDALDEAAARRS